MGEKKHKDSSEASESKKKKKKEKKEDGEVGGESSKKKEKKEGGKKKKDEDKSEKESKDSKKKEKKKKKDDDDDAGLNEILKAEDKAANIKRLEEQVELLKDTLKKRKDVDIMNLPAAAKLQVENDYLEAKVRELKAKYERLEDKFDIIKKAHKNATEGLNQAHTQAMDQEEMEFMRIQLETKRNDLAEARNLIRELQKVGWSMLPPKVADESKKTEKELETVQKNVKIAEDEANAKKETLSKLENQLQEVQQQYQDAKKHGRSLEETLDGIVSDIAKLQQEIESKTEEAREMELALKAVKGQIEASGGNINEPAAPEPPPPEVETISPEELARQDEKKRKKQEKKDKKNKEKDELKQKHDALRDQVNAKEEELRQLKKESKEFQRITKEAITDKNAVKKMEAEKLQLTKDLNETKKSYEKETVLRKMYYNIIEDMLGKVKVYARVRQEAGKEGIAVVDEYSLKVLGSKPQEFQFDQVFGPKSTAQEVFKACDYLYEQANEGFNCCCMVYGETGAGKTFTCIGAAENEGIIKKGISKVGDLLKKNKKNQLQTRVTMYVIEIYEDKIYDLVKDELNLSLDIKRDYYGMVVIPHAEYKECATDDDLKKVFAAAVENRKNAHTKLDCKPNQSHFVTTITIEIGNKFQHKYSKGKVTIIKLAGCEKLGTGSMSASLSALGDVISALSTEKPFIPYKHSKLTMLIQDALGGGAKTLMIACISPLDNHLVETVNTLTYASRVKAIKNDALKNTDSEEVYKMKNNIERLVRGLKMETISIAV